MVWFFEEEMFIIMKYVSKMYNNYYCILGLCICIQLDYFNYEILNR